MTMWQPNRKSDGKPIYLHLADALAADIQAGVLRPGERLPTHRDLAEVMGVTVGTVTRGYAEAGRRGLTRGTVGRGTVVALGLEERPPFFFHAHPGPTVADMGMVTPLYALDPDLGSALQAIAAMRHAQDLLRYQPSMGCRRHREAGVEWVRRYGIEANADEILVTCGGQHGLLVLLTGLFRPGDRILAESLSYPGLVRLASLLGLRLVPVEMDHQGIIPEAVTEASAKEGVRGLYLMPNCHNPTTVPLPAGRREQIAALARQRNLLIIEDECYGMTADLPASPFAALVPERTFLVAGFSKPVAGGLRISYVRTPKEHADRLSQGIASTTWMAAPLCAEVATLWINDGTAAAVLARKKEEARERNGLARRILAGQRIRSQGHGYFIWLELPEPWHGSEFECEALDRGVVVVGAAKFVVGLPAPLPRAVRVSLSAAKDRQELATGLETIARILRGPPGAGRCIL